MRGGRIFIILGIILVLGAVVLAVVWYTRSRPAAPVGPVGEAPTPEPTAVPVLQIVVAVQNIPRGMRITEESNAVLLREWPESAAPEGMITDLESVYGTIARRDIPRGMPVLRDMITTRPGDLGAAGSDAALQIPEGRVAIAVPVGYYSSIAWALQPGDHVDMIVSMPIVDLDEEFQTVPPNQATCVSPPEGEGCKSGEYGRLEVLPNGWVVNLTPGGGQEQWPRLVTQLTVQDAIVLQVGEWPSPKELYPEPTPTPEPSAEGETAPPVEPSLPVDRIEPVTLAVTRQDALVLEYAQIIGARINFVLRRAGDTQPAATESVTLQYLMERFAIQVPPKLPYGVTPPIRQVAPIPRDEIPAQYGPSQYGVAQ